MAVSRLLSYSSQYLVCSLGLFVGCTISSKLASAQVIPDSTLGNEASTITPNVNIKGTTSTLVNGGAVRGINLFHSFQEFNISNGQGVYFTNPQGIQNIINRVTGSASYIGGTIGVLGNANLFLINPNGIIFGPNASLDVGGSFVATTAHAIQFENLGTFDALNPSSPPLLTINPSGFLFSRANIAPITNLSRQPSGTYSYVDPNSIDPSSSTSQATSVNIKGLRVPDNHSLLLLGGEVVIDGGGLYALGGQIEIGSVAGESLVGLSFNNNDLSLNFPSNIERGNISLLRGAKIDASGSNSGGGSIHLAGKNIKLKDGSQVISLTTGPGDGGTISLDATDVVELIDPVPFGVISTITYGSGKAGDIKIFTKGLLTEKGVQITSSSFTSANGGNITIDATEFILLRGLDSGIFSASGGSGSGGNISIKTLGNLALNDGASIVSGAGFSPFATGAGGEITILAGNAVQIDNDSTISTSHFGSGEAGNINIETNSLLVSNASGIELLSPQGQAGTLTVKAASLVLNRGRLVADTGITGANIILQISNILRMENESRITARARSNNANGGSIQIDAPILLALPPTGSRGSDIIANAISGTGGNIEINAQGVFGIEERKAFDNSQGDRIKNSSNDIDASSQFGSSGQVDIHTTTDPNQGLVELPSTVVDPSTLVAQNACRRGAESEFTNSGRGGLPANPNQDLSNASAQVGLVEPTTTQTSTQTQKQSPTASTTPQKPIQQSIVPAQGWVYNEKGEIVLVAYNPSVTSPQRLKDNTACAGQ
jgi:filamentous hemagglutinin family protein